MKIERDPIPLVYPNPVVLVTSVGADSRPNVITLTLVGAACGKPPVVGIGVWKNQHSRRLIEESGEFVVNIPRARMLQDVEYCGLVSGRDVDKCSEASFTLMPSKRVKPPLIEECPLNLECEVKKMVPLGSSVLFLGEVVCLHVDDAILDEKGGVDLAKAAPIVFNLTNSYWGIGEKLADYGFSRSKSE